MWAERGLNYRNGIEKQIINYCLLSVYMLCLWQFNDLLADEQLLKFKRLSVSEGLSQNTVNCILQDSYGFIWLGTDDGLNRYDGYEFRKYYHNPADTTSISDNNIRCMIEMPGNKIWVGTLAGGISILDNETGKFSKYNLDIEYSNQNILNGVFAIHRDRFQKLWVMHTNGLIRFEMEGDSLSDPQYFWFNEIVSSAYFQHFTVDKNGDAWVLKNRKLFSLDIATGRFLQYHKNPNHRFNKYLCDFLYSDKSARLWMTKSTESGENEICEFNFDENRWEKFIQTDEKKFFGALESENDFFFYGESGIIRFNPDLPDDQKIILYNENIDAPVLSALVNRDGTLWLGSFGYGAYRLSSITSRFLSYPPDASPENRWKSIRTIYVDPDGILWLGTYDGLYLIDREKNTISLKNIYEKNVSKEMQVVYSIYDDPEGNGDTLWLGIEGDDLIRLNRKTGEFKFFRVNSEDPNSVAGRVMTGIMRDKKGRLWVSTLNGVSRMKPESDQFDNYYHDPFDSSSLSSNQTICIMEDSQQRIWVGTISGLNQYLPESDSFRRYMYNPLQPGGLKARRIEVIYESKHPDFAGKLWLGTAGGGLVEMIEQPDGTINFKHYTSKNDLANNVVYGILEDEDGNFWMSSNKGISKYNIRSGTFKNYDIEDGLQDNEFNAKAFFKGTSGEMFFGGVNGLNMFYPSELGISTFKAPVRMTDFKIFNKSVDLGKAPHDVKNIELNYTDNVFSFEFAALDYNSPSKNQYAYKMEGFNKDWIQLHTKRDITFTNLDPGAYRLNIKATNSDGIWNESDILSIGINILPPFWDTWWFRYLIAVILIIGLWLFFKWRTSDIVNKNKELELLVEGKIVEIRQINERLLSQEKLANLGKLITVVSHELRNPLGTIRSAFFSLNEMIAPKDQTINRVMERAERNIQRCDTIIKELLDFTRLPKLCLETVQINDLIREVIEESNIHETIEVRLKLDATHALHIDIEQIRRCLINLIDNACHAMLDEIDSNKRYRLTISSWDGSNGIFVVIEDNGPGIPLELRKKIFEPLFSTKGFGVGMGLPITKQIVELHQGRIEVDNSVGNGTAMRIFLPLFSRSKKIYNDLIGME